MAKIPKTIDEQIALLKERGMSFDEKTNVAHYLGNISYYRLKGYWWEMQEDFVNHQFKGNSWFEDVIELYNFDQDFRLIVFNAIEDIEIALRTKMIYHLSLGYGGEWYINSKLFQNQSHHDEFKSKISKEINESNEVFIKKHKNNHPDEKPEAWKALEVITLGTLSRLFENINHQLREKSIIANEFGLYNQKTLSSWLRTITVIRNIIAHHGRLWNRPIINRYDWPHEIPLSILNYIPSDYERRKIFPILSAIIYLNNHISPGHNIKSDLLNLFDKFDEIPLSKMGFPANWKEQHIWG